MSTLIKSRAVNVGPITDEKEFTFNGKTAIIIGANEKGKSTIIEGLASFLKGNKDAELLNQNAETGELEYLLSSGERFLLTLKRDKPSKAVYITKDGKKEAATKKIAERFFPKQLDLNRFIALSAGQQRTELTKTLGVDTSALDAEEKTKVKERENIGREKKRLESIAITLGTFNPELPAEEVDAKKIIEYLKEANDWNDAINAENTKKSQHIDSVAELEEKIKQLQKELEETKALVNTSEEWIASHAPIPTETITTQEESLNKIGEINKAIRKNIDIRNNTVLLDKQTEKYNEHTEQIEAIRQKKSDLFKAASVPDNIEITDDGILIDGLPVTNGQHAKSKIGVSELKLARLTMGEAEWLTFDASPLDRSNIEKLKEWAKTEGVQLLVELPNRGSEKDDELHFVLEG